jgi:hypothetical protein
VPNLLQFQDALRLCDDAKPKLLLGNGFSRACRDDIFAYGALFDRADFRALSASARAAFAALQTTDFERVMRALLDATALARAYESQTSAVARAFETDADGLRNVLVQTIAENHPAHPGEISEDRYAACRTFLANFGFVYTLNYDLLLYWALMHADQGPAINHDDGFRTPDAGPTEYVSWDIDKSNSQNVFYLHGALHLFDAGSELVKYTWCNTGVRLIEQVREALLASRYPLFVAEGTSDQKYERIRHSDFLSRAYRSFANIGGTLFVHGHSFSANDDHILRLMERGKVKSLFVGLFGDPESESNATIARRANQLAITRPTRRPLAVKFYDAASANVWG